MGANHAPPKQVEGVVKFYNTQAGKSFKRGYVTITEGTETIDVFIHEKVVNKSHSQGLLPEPTLTQGQTVFVTVIKTTTNNKPGWKASKVAEEEFDDVEFIEFNEMMSFLNSSVEPLEDGTTSPAVPVAAITSPASTPVREFEEIVINLKPFEDDKFEVLVSAFDNLGSPVPGKLKVRSLTGMSAPVEVSIGEDGVGSGQLTVESDEEYKFFFTSEEGYTVISKEIELPGPKKQVSPSNWDKFCAWWGKWSNVLYLVLSGICVLVWLTTAVYVVGYLYNVTTTPYQGSVREKRDKFAQRYEARGKPVPQTQINKLYPETNHFSGARASFGAIATLVTIPVLFVGFILCFIDDVVRFVKRRLDEVKGIAGWLEGREGVKPITMRHHLVENPGLVTYLVDGAEVVADKLSSLFTTRRALPTATQPAANAGVPWFQLVTSNLVGEIIEAAIKQMFSSERRLK